MKEADEKIVDPKLVDDTTIDTTSDDDDEEGDTKDDLKAERQKKVEQQNAIFANGLEQEKQRVKEEMEEAKEKREEKAYPKKDFDESEEEATKYTNIVMNEKVDYGRKATIAGLAVIAGFENAGRELRIFLERFSQAQLNHDANFKPGAPQEGPADYRNILKKANEVASLIEGKDPNVTLQEIADKYTDLIKDVKKFRADHKPKFRGHTTTESAQRYQLMGELYEHAMYTAKSIKSLGRSAKAAMQELGQDISLSELKIGDAKQTIVNTFNPGGATPGDINMEEFTKEASVTADQNLADEARMVIVKAIMRGLRNNTSNNLDIYGYYKSEPDEDYDINMNCRVRPIKELIEGAMAKRILDKCKDPNVGVNELRDIYNDITNGNFKKDAEALSRNRAVAFKMMLADKEGNEKQLVANAIVNSHYEITNQVRKNVDIMRNGTVEEWAANNNLVEAPPYVSYGLAYNYLLSEMMSKNINYVQYGTASRSHIISDETKQEMEDTRNRIYSKFLRNSNIMDDMVDKPLTDERMHELVRRLENPKFKKQFNNMAMKVEKAIFDRNLGEAKANLRRNLSANKAAGQNKPEGPNKTEKKPEAMGPKR